MINFDNIPKDQYLDFLREHLSDHEIMNIHQNIILNLIQRLGLYEMFNWEVITIAAVKRYPERFNTAEKQFSRNDRKSRDWVAAVKHRDQYICKKCGWTEHLVAHHIIPVVDRPELGQDLDNGVLLCSHCHLVFHSKYGKSGCNRKDIEEYLGGYS